MFSLLERKADKLFVSLSLLNYFSYYLLKVSSFFTVKYVMYLNGKTQTVNRDLSQCVSVFAV